MRAVKFDDIEACLAGPPRGRPKKGYRAGYRLVVHFPRHGMAFREGNRRWGDHLPSSLLGRQSFAAFPWARRRGLAPRVSELYSRYRALCFHETHDARVSVTLLVVPESGAAVSDAPARLHVRHFLK